VLQEIENYEADKNEKEYNAQQQSRTKEDIKN
jgi:hypothetical protein